MGRRTVEFRNNEAAQDAFLDALSRGHTMGYAAKVSGYAYTTIKRHREKNPEFDVRVLEAYEIGTDVWEEAGRVRAVDGFDEPIYQGGMHVGDKRKYSDTLYMFLMKARDRSRYGDKVTTHESEEDDKAMDVKILEARKRARKARLGVDGNDDDILA